MVDYTELDRTGLIGPTGAVGARPRAPGRWRHMLRPANLWFWAIVGVPTLIAGIYYFAIASNLYMTEASFLVRGPKPAASSSLGAMLQGAGVSQTGQDTSAVEDYIMSRDAVRKLEKNDDLRAVLDRRQGDIVTRYPGIFFWRHDFEALYASYKHFVSVDTNTETGITTLRVKAYRAQDAQAVAKALLLYAEQLVNDMNIRAREDTLRIFKQEVKTDEADMARVQDELTVYRVKHNMLDPKTSTVGPLGVQTGLDTSLANARSQLAELRVDSPHSPQIPLVRTRIAALEQAVREERAKISGDSDSVATAMSGYERLNLQEKIDVRALASAFSSLEAAQLQAESQQLYLEDITQPNLADYPLYPKRFYSFVMVLASCLLTYGIAWLLVASVREHQAA